MTMEQQHKQQWRALQHQQGESALGGKECFDKRRIENVSRWLWEALKAQLGVL